MSADVRFEREVLAHLELVRRFAYRLTRDRSAAEDCAQESMLRAFESFDRYKEQGAARAWLCTIVLNEFRNSQRERRRLERIARDQLEETSDSTEPTPEWADPALEPAIEALSPRLREVVRLRQQRLSYRQISERLAIPMGTVMSRLHRAKEAMRRTLEAA